MGQTESYAEFMPKKDVPDNWEGLDEHRIMFEKKLSFLLLLQKMGSHGFIGSAKHNKSIRDVKITRTDIKNYLESFEIKKFLDWIKTVCPEKVLKLIEKENLSLKFDFDLCHEIEKDKEYIKLVYPKKRELICEIYNDSIGLEQKKKIFDIMFNEYSTHIDKFKIFNMYLSKYSELLQTDEQIENFFKNDIDLLDKNKIENYIKDQVKILNSEKKSASIFGFITQKNPITLKQSFEIIKNIQDIKFINSLTLEQIKKKLFTGMDLEEKIKFIDDFFDNSSDTQIVNFVDKLYIRVKEFEKISENKKFKQFESNVKYNLLRTKYFDKLDEEKQSKLQIYRLDFDSHYELYKLDEAKYMGLIMYNDLIDDFTFDSYTFDSYDFLNGFNDEVKTYLKNKIYSDSNGLNEFEQRHTPITTLDNYIDIMYFTHNPPVFLRQNSLHP